VSYKEGYYGLLYISHAFTVKCVTDSFSLLVYVMSNCWLRVEEVMQV
jgi:hypothetical protein